MFQGLTTKLSESVVASAATISPKTDIIHVTGTTPIVNINATFGGGFSGILFIVPVGAFTTTTAGNINNVSTGIVGQLMIMVYSKTNKKWYPSY